VFSAGLQEHRRKVESRLELPKITDGRDWAKSGVSVTVALGAMQLRHEK
jgi:hypothetical protein